MIGKCNQAGHEVLRHAGAQALEVRARVGRDDVAEALEQPLAEHLAGGVRLAELRPAALPVVIRHVGGRRHRDVAEGQRVLADIEAVRIAANAVVHRIGRRLDRRQRGAALDVIEVGIGPDRVRGERIDTGDIHQHADEVRDALVQRHALELAQSVAIRGSTGEAPDQGVSPLVGEHGEVHRGVPPRCAPAVEADVEHGRLTLRPREGERGEERGVHDHRIALGAPAPVVRLLRGAGGLVVPRGVEVVVQPVRVVERLDDLGVDRDIAGAGRRRRVAGRAVLEVLAHRLRRIVGEREALPGGGREEVVAERVGLGAVFRRVVAHVVEGIDELSGRVEERVVERHDVVAAGLLGRRRQPRIGQAGDHAALPARLLRHRRRHAAIRHAGRVRQRVAQQRGQRAAIVARVDQVFGAAELVERAAPRELGARHGVAHDDLADRWLAAQVEPLGRDGGHDAAVRVVPDRALGRVRERVRPSLGAGRCEWMLPGGPRRRAAIMQRGEHRAAGAGAIRELASRVVDLDLVPAEHGDAVDRQPVGPDRHAERALPAPGEPAIRLAGPRTGRRPQRGRRRTRIAFRLLGRSGRSARERGDDERCRQPSSDPDRHDGDASANPAKPLTWTSP